VLTGITITLLHKLLKSGKLIGHFGVVPANSQASNKDLFGIISLMISTISKHSPDTDLVFFQKFATSQTTLQPLFSNTSSLIIICRVEIETKELASIEDLQSR
jgi:hypothetical protein